MPSRRIIAGVGIATLLAGGCTSLKQYVHNGYKVGPNFSTPSSFVAPTWIDATDSRVRSETDDLSRWWTVFNDPSLNTLIDEAYRQNLTLREAGYRILQARAELGIAKGELFPQQQVMDGGFSQKGVSVAVANREATPTRFFGTWTYGFGLQWELDFWGKFRRAIETGEANLNASIFNYDDVLVTLLGDVASQYVELRTLEAQLAFTRTNAKLQQETLALAKAQFQGGQVSELDVDQAQSNLSTTEAEIPQIEIQIRKTSNRICILLGVPASDLQKLLAPGPIPTAPPTVAVGVPADLLRRRPDVRRAESVAAARSAQIGIAETEFYPAIGIGGTIGWGAANFSDLFIPEAFTGSVGPGFQWKILNYGRLLNNVKAKDAQFQQQVADYQNTVLKAGEEVENGLITFLKSHERAKASSEGVAAAEKAVKVALVQYKAGLIDFNRVALLEQNLVGQQNQLAQANGQIAQGLIHTYRALGGGWELGRCTPEAPPVPQAIINDNSKLFDAKVLPPR
ncbi:efflux transporter outer membrane subunit [soil metagenome]